MMILHHEKPQLKRVLVVGTFMHQLGHYSTFPHDLANGFFLNGAEVTLIAPLKPAQETPANIPYRFICLEEETPTRNPIAKKVWELLRHSPILLALVWIAFKTQPNDYELVYWTDFKADNQQSTWILAFAQWLGIYRHNTAFTEHYEFSWKKHRLQRLLKMDRLRLRKIQFITHSKELLKWTQLNMRWPEKGIYIPWGLWPIQDEKIDRPTARSRLEIANNSRVLLVFGVQAIVRKNIGVLAEAIDAMELPTPLTIVFAGPRTATEEAHPFDKPTLKSKPNLTVIRNEGFIENKTADLYFTAADGVWAYYRNFIGASGVLCQAMAHGRLSICAKNAECGAPASDYRISLMPSNTSIEELKGTLFEFLQMCPEKQSAYEASARIAAEDLAWPRITKKIIECTTTTNS